MRSAQLTPRTSRYPSDPIGLSAVAEVEILGDTSSSLRLCYFILFFLLSAKLSFACFEEAYNEGKESTGHTYGNLCSTTVSNMTYCTDMLVIALNLKL
jgi:hypothetical protein